MASQNNAPRTDGEKGAKIKAKRARRHPERTLESDSSRESRNTAHRVRIRQQRDPGVPTQKYALTPLSSVPRYMPACPKGIAQQERAPSKPAVQGAVDPPATAQTTHHRKVRKERKTSHNRLPKRSGTVSHEPPHAKSATRVIPPLLHLSRNMTPAAYTEHTIALDRPPAPSAWMLRKKKFPDTQRRRAAALPPPYSRSKYVYENVRKLTLSQRFFVVKTGAKHPKTCKDALRFLSSLVMFFERW